MFLGLDSFWWFIVGLGLIAICIAMQPSKKKTNGDKHFGLFNDEVDENMDGYIKSLQEITEMGWVRLRVNPEDMDTVLNTVEELKISVLYQFFLREHKYDMLFRCQKSKLEDFKKAMDAYIPPKY